MVAIAAFGFGALIPLNVFVSTSDNFAEWFLAGCIWTLVLGLGFLWFPPAMDYSSRSDCERRLRSAISARKTRFRSQVIEAVPAGECVEITHYRRRQGLLSAPHEERRRYPVSDEESIYEYVDQLRRGPDPIEHDPSAVAIANVINKRRK